jgi:hypothetical protein
MIAQVKADLDAIIGNVSVLKSAKGAGRIFELYIMTGIAVELQRRGWSVCVQRSDGSIIGPRDSDRRFIQRAGSPTGVTIASKGSGNASSIVIAHPKTKREWEIWNGIQFIGRSGAKHEVDIAIVPREVGTTLRTAPSDGYPIGRPNVAIECKEVVAPGDSDEMRSFVARLYDLTILHGHRSDPNLPSPLQSIYPSPSQSARPSVTYWSANRSHFDVLARSSGFRRGAISMTQYFNIRPASPVRFGTPEYHALIDDLASWSGRQLA